jgi:hypothetical protein
VPDADGHWCWVPDSAVANLASLLGKSSVVQDAPHKLQKAPNPKVEATAK